MAGTGILRQPRDPKADTRTKRGQQRISGAPRDLLLDPSLTVDDTGRLKVVPQDNGSLVMASMIFTNMVPNG